MWKEVNAIFKDMIANDIVADSDVDERAHNETDSNSLEDVDSIADGTQHTDKAVIESRKGKTKITVTVTKITIRNVRQQTI